MSNRESNLGTGLQAHFGQQKSSSAHWTRYLDARASCVAQNVITPKLLWKSRGRRPSYVEDPLWFGDSGLPIVP